MKAIRTIILEEGAKYGAYIYVSKTNSRGTSSYIVVKCAECGDEKEVRKYDFRLSTQRCFSCGYDPGKTEIEAQYVPKIPKRKINNENSIDPEFVYSTRSKSRVRKLYEIYNPNKVCNCCGISEWLGEPLHPDIDHIIPLHAGGENKLSNMQYLCSNCHRVKTAKENFGQPLKC